MKILPPLAALAIGAMALAACGNDDKMAENTYSVPSENNSSGYPSAQPATPSPGTLGNPSTDTPRAIPPANPDDPSRPTPAPMSPPTPLPPT